MFLSNLLISFQEASTEKLYDTRTMQCQWNKTWTPTDILDECVWVQCMYPPQVIISIGLYFSIKKDIF